MLKEKKKMAINDILDFTDYAKPFDFKFNENVYRIPAFSKVQIEKLMNINKKFIEIGKSVDKTLTDLIPGEDKDMTVEELETSKTYFDMQDEFIACALLRKIGDGSFAGILENELTDWPVKVKNKVMKVISDQMSMSVEDEEPEKKS
jgi:hypothetical protein